VAAVVEVAAVVNAPNNSTAIPVASGVASRAFYSVPAFLEDA